MATDGSPEDGDPVESESVESLPLGDALSIVGDETRARILRALGESREDGGVAPEPLGFSELMERVGVEDSGLFNYHLEKLVGTFVERREEGYALRLPGQLFHRALLAGTLTERRSVEPYAVGDCPACDGRLHARYRPDHLLTVRCGGCDRLVDAVHLPARALDGRTTGELLDAAYGRRHSELGSMRRGVCHGCGGRVARELRPVDEDSALPSCDRPVHAVLRCQACHTAVFGHPAVVSLAAPAVVGFFADHGRDAALARGWDDPVLGAMESLVVAEDDPLVVEITYELEGDRLRIAVDEELRVVEAERTSG